MKNSHENSNHNNKPLWDDTYKRHFGSLTLEAAHLNLQAFCDDDTNRAIAYAWLGRDKARVRELVGDVGKGERNRLVREALTNVTHQLVSHMGTARYRDQLPRNNG